MSEPFRNVPVERLKATAGALSGLDSDELENSRARYGSNQILERAPRGWVDVLADSARDPMLWFLIVTATLFAVLEQWDEALVLIVALLPLLGMDAYLHQRTHASIRGLGSRLAPHANVERDGRPLTVESSELVVGDLVILKAGDTIPADGLMLQTEHVQIDESVLNGEAMPVEKSAVRLADAPDCGSAAEPDAPQTTSLDASAQWPVEYPAWGFAGTRMLTGSARMRIVFVGQETLYGEIAHSATTGSKTRTPLQLAVSQLVRVLVIIALLLCVLLAWVRYQQGHGLIDALISALTLAIAALPEEFPVVLSLFLGVGVYRLARRQALVRRAVVVENIGRVTCICSDKTGTITEGRLQIDHLEVAAADSSDHLLSLATMASRRETGDPMDLALLDACPEQSSHPLGPGWTVEQTFPFTEDRLRETQVMRNAAQLLAATKGAPEVILAQCSLDPVQLAHWSALVTHHAQQGRKVIACAWQSFSATDWLGAEPEQGFQFAGLICFADPVRPGVRQALQTCAQAGIRVLMVTGDHAGTAGAIAQKIGLSEQEPRIIHGSDLVEQLARGRLDVLRGIDVVCRAAPRHKLELVRALQSQGEIVAVTGDGINDVPALQAADIGIAMGRRGTRTAREVAPIVLLDDDFASIVGAISEGRQLFINLQMSFQYLLMIHLPLVLTAALLPLIGYPILYLPVHIVWLELIIHPTALLVFQAQPRSGPLRKAARSPSRQFFGHLQWLLILATGAILSAVVAFAFVHGLQTLGDVDHARAIALATLISASAGITAGLTRLRTRSSQWMVCATLLLSFALIEIRPLASLLHLTPLHPDDLLIVAGATLAAGLLAALSSPRSGTHHD